MTRGELEQEFRSLLAAHFPGPVPESLVRSLLLAAGGYTASQIEERCRTPVSQQGPGRQQEQQRGRKTA